MTETHLTDDDDDRCLDDRDEDTCRGPVGYHSIGSGNAFPRCDHHWDERLKRREGSMEMYESSDVVPDWFDPTIAGESWFPDE